ncbi:MAG: hypothetical protein R2875_15285 [Desulfobacterales bacterium]
MKIIKINQKSQSITGYHRIFPAPIFAVSGYRVPQMQGIGLRSVQVVREQADSTTDAVPCDPLTEIIMTKNQLKEIFEDYWTNLKLNFRFVRQPSAFHLIAGSFSSKLACPIFFLFPLRPG